MIFFSILGDLTIEGNSKILYVGWGYGKFLRNLHELNFKNLHGFDPYLKEEIHTKNLNIIKKTIHQLPNDEKFDIIFFNHSFEHIKEQRETLEKACELFYLQMDIV